MHTPPPRFVLSRRDSTGKYHNSKEPSSMRAIADGNTAIPRCGVN
jgi:hypothetical protein